MSHDPNFDFRSIGQQVRDTVKSYTQDSDIGKTISSMAQDIQNAFKSGVQPPRNPQPPFSPQPPIPQPSKDNRKTKIPGRAAGILFTVFGGIGLGVASIVFLAMLLIFIVEPDMETLRGMIAGLVPLLICVTLLSVGAVLRGRTRRFRQYLQQIGDSAFCPVEFLGSYTGRSLRETARDLKKMIALGVLPDAHLVDEETCLILNYETYQYYLQARKREEEARQAKAAAPVDTESAFALVAEGRAMLRQIRACNDALPGEEISRKLNQLETTSDAIFRYVEEQPDKLPEIRRFLQYYLPSTLKLLETYRKFNDQPVYSDRQEETKAQIEGALDTINAAFVRLLDSLTQTERMNVSADISVIKTMLEQEGLSGQSVTPSKPE